MRLPELAARPQRAERPSLDTVRPTDLGLGAVAQEIGAWQAEVDRTRELELEVQQKADEDAVEPIVQEAQTRFEAKFAESGARWDGVSPGFARAQQAELDYDLAPVLARGDLPSGQRDALQRRLSQYREATGQRAIQYESQRRGQLAAEQQAARQSTELGAVIGAYTAEFGAKVAEIEASYDGSQPNYTANVLAAHDEVAAARIEAASEASKPRVTQQMNTLRLQAQARAIDVEVRGEQAYVARVARTAGEQMINGVLSAPSMYETALTNVDQVVSGLAAGPREAVRAELTNELTESYITALIRKGEHDSALSQLNSGTLDARLKPETKARLLGAATSASERLTVDDYMVREDMQQAVRDDLASLAETGVGLDLDPTQVAEALGPAAAAEWLSSRGPARSVSDGLVGLSQMTNIQMMERLEGLKPEPGSEGFEAASRVYDLTAAAVRAEQARRMDDPAKWAIDNSPQLQTWLAGFGSDDPAVRRRSARAYGSNVLAAQIAVGIDGSAGRILPKAIAEATLANAMQNPDRTAGLQWLGQWVQLFDAPPGATPAEREAGFARRWQVVRSLSEAHADQGDLAAAITFANDPAGMGRYIASTRSNALGAMKPNDRGGLQAAVSQEMAPFRNSFAIGAQIRPVLDGQVVMAQRIAADMVAKGSSQRDAVREATRVVTSQFEIIGPHSLRVPAAEVRRNGAFRLDGMDGASYILRGLAQERERLLANDGALLQTPPDEGRGMTPEQSRRRYADSVRLTARWVSTPETSGAILVRPNLEGRMTPVLLANGSVITRSWAQARGEAPIRDEASPPRARPGASAAGSAGGRTPRGVRNNNPLNIRPNGDRWQGARGIDGDAAGGFVQFETPLHGARAAAVDLRTKFGRGLDTVQEIIPVWAPAHENNVGAYVGAVSRALGVTPSTRLDLNNPTTLARLMSAMADHENGPGRFTLELMRQGVAAAMR